MTDIATFLMARVDEDEAAANEFYAKRASDIFTHQNALFQAKSLVLGLELVKSPRLSAIEYEALNRVLAEVAAKRAILADYILTCQIRDAAAAHIKTAGDHPSATVLEEWDRARGEAAFLERILWQLAAPYADHPDYRFRLGDRRDLTT